MERLRMSIHSGSQVISRTAKVGGDPAASSAGHGLDQMIGSPDLLLSSSQDSSEHSTNGKSTRVGVCPARVSVHTEDAHEAERESIMDDFLSSSSHDRGTSRSEGSVLSGSRREPGRIPSTTSSSASTSPEPGSQAHHAHDLPESGRASVVDTMPSPSSSEIGPTVLDVDDEGSMSDTALGNVENRGHISHPLHTSLPQLSTPPPHTPPPRHHG